MLVAVGIIGLLAAVLIPGLGRARELSADARCKSNLRQMWEMIHAGDGVAMPAPSGCGSRPEAGAGHELATGRKENRRC